LDKAAVDMQRQPQSGAEGELVYVATGPVTLEGNLAVPEGARGLVLFAHGSGSSRYSPRNGFVANYLRQGGLGTLLVDLLTAEEESVDLRTRHHRFDIRLLAERLSGAIAWLLRNPETSQLPIGLFGSSTGGGAALVAATMRPSAIDAVVSRGGRPDLAGPALPRVQTPTLLIVGGHDYPVIEMNRDAMAQMRDDVTKELVIVPRATHLFEEAGALEEVSRLARDWFIRYLKPTDEAVPDRGKWERALGVWVWCQVCRRCYIAGEEREIEGGLWCAYEDCEHGDIYDTFDWVGFRESHPEWQWPKIPVRGVRYNPPI
jgi:putative phosphoribosyl transferase